MEIMHQQSSSPLDGRWRGHVPLPYAAHGTALPASLHHLRQQHQQQQRPLHHLHPQQQHLPQQQEQQLQLQQQLQQHNRHSLKQSRSQQSAEAGSSRGHPSHPSSSSSSSSSHSLLASPQPSPDTPAQGKSGGAKEDVDKKEGVEWEQYNAGAAFLGPTLWDKTLSYDSDLKLEYMDLDEFLNENGIPIEASKVVARGGGGGGTGGGPTGLAANTKSGGDGNTTGGSGEPEPTSPTASVSPEAASPSSPNSTPVGLGVGPQGPPHPALPQGPAPATPAPPPPQSAPPPSLSPQNHLGDEYCSSDSGSPHSPALQVHEGVPGQDFDPRTRCFTEEELKPQPMIKKSRKQFVPVELKDEKYWARRRKNNMAAKRSRDARRLKENQIAMRANFLEKENDVLTTELQKAQAVVEALKKRLAVYEVV